MSKHAPARPEAEVLLLHRLSADERIALRRKLPALTKSVLVSVQFAADTTAEPVGALGHLAFARAEINAILDALLAKVRRRRAQ